MGQLIYNKKYTLTTENFDLNDSITPCAILNYFQDIAGRHAELLNVGFENMLRENCIWVILRVRFKILDALKMNDDILVTTWPKENGKLDYTREYKIQVGNDDKIIGSSQWVIIDLNSRRLKRGNYVQFSGEFLEKYNFGSPLEKLKNENYDNMQLIGEEKVKYAYLDHNGHLNNARYAEIISNCLRLTKKEKIVEMQIDFQKEALLDETLFIYKNQNENKIYIEGRNKEEAICFRSELVVEKC